MAAWNARHHVAPTCSAVTAPNPLSAARAQIDAITSSSSSTTVP